MNQPNRTLGSKRKDLPEIYTEDAKQRRRESLMKVLNLTRSLNLQPSSPVSRKQFVYPQTKQSQDQTAAAQKQRRMRRILNPAMNSRGPALSPSAAYITMMKLCDKLESDIASELAQNPQE